MLNNINKKFVIVGVVSLLFVTVIIPGINAGTLVSQSNNNIIVTSISFNIGQDKTLEEVLSEIQEIENKDLTIEKQIGNRQVKYWEHMVNGIVVKNDSILLNTDAGETNVLKYSKCWTNIDEFLSDYQYDTIFEPNNYFWKQLVIFPDEDDCRDFYSFYNGKEFPIVCLEVRHRDGTTIMYNLDGEVIGNGVPTPGSDHGFSLSGYDEEWSGHDPWDEWRDNAAKWFSKWCISVDKKALPSPSEISDYIENPLVSFFFELAHGSSYEFQTDKKSSYYTSDRLEDDMDDRRPMKFAFIGSCEGMTKTGPGTFSYEFRKGKIDGTVTVGFDKMQTSEGWEYSLEWQDFLFEKMDSGYKIKEAFDLASAEYPKIANNVKFAGDSDMSMYDDQDFAITVKRIRQEDEIDPGTDADWKLRIYVNGQRKNCKSDGNDVELNKALVWDRLVTEDIKLLEIKMELQELDPFNYHDIADISAHDGGGKDDSDDFNKHRGAVFMRTYNLETNAWAPEDDNNDYLEKDDRLGTYITSGNFDGSIDKDENDVSVWFDIIYKDLPKDPNEEDPPTPPIITGPNSGESDKSYEYHFTSWDSNDADIYYYVDWGDDSNAGWVGPFYSGRTLTLSHEWKNDGNYIITAKAKNIYDIKSDPNTLELSIKKSRLSTNLLSHFILERFPMLKNLISKI